MKITDCFLLDKIIKQCEGDLDNENKPINYGEQIKKEFGGNITNKICKFHPLDEDVKNILEQLQNQLVEKEIPYESNEDINNLWVTLIRKAIMCLRFFDKREPFQNQQWTLSKAPEVYGMSDLIKYHEKYCDFEAILYGGDSYYRDHIFHAIRCWMLGVYILLSENTNITDNSERFINSIHIEGESLGKSYEAVSSELKDKYSLEEGWEKRLSENKRIYLTLEDETNEGMFNYLYIKKKELKKENQGDLPEKYIVNEDNFSNNINILEKISMWTIIALCHDLGYPLEKSTKILDKTREMMGVFVAQPKIWSDINFNGVQDNINDYIIKFMSSKMKMYNNIHQKETLKDKEEHKEYKRQYLGRIQPKYYLKYTKSLEHYSHGIISSIIIYKMLLYFMEADNNLNDDYIYKQEDARQFYIRREILRAMASHTCKDIYQMQLTTFTSLLFLCDEMQEWGRKSWKNLYEGTSSKLAELELKMFNDKKIDYTEMIEMKNATCKQILNNISRIFENQYILYKTTFRDGQDTAKRKFDIHKTMIININKDKFEGIENIDINFEINHNEKDSFKVTIKKDGDNLNDHANKLIGTLENRINDYKKQYEYDEIKCEK
ncbi:hypothetical protein [Intestinibacter sp.]|uniref:hypothetical protein n=1 Tax=Intestinibacter sp. TaxID=1965304 RepID=UPI003AB68839